LSKFNFCSSCLSRAIVAKIILDLCSIPNKLSLGISKNKYGIKVAHAWISDPKTGYIFTNGLPKDGVVIFNF